MDDEEYRRKLVKNIQMLATLVATATYTAGFNPPGGVWQDIHDATGQHLPGDPIMRSTHHGRYVAFFYCNAAAFAFSLAVVVLTLLVTGHPKTIRLIGKHRSFPVILMSLMLVAMLALAAAYGAGAFQDKLSTVAWYCILVPAAFISQVIVLIRLRGSGGSSRGGDQAQAADDEEDGKDFRKLMVPVSMFSLTITYVAGLSTPGGVWDSAEGGHRPGDAILKDRRTLAAFVYCNTTAFAASLYSVSIVMHKKTSVTGPLARFNNIITVVLGLLCGLLGAYISASSRGRTSTPWLTVAVLVCIVLYVAASVIVMKAINNSQRTDGMRPKTVDTPGDGKARKKRGQPKLVQLMASLAVAITYQAGLYPPGGLWPTNTDGHTAGDPILLTTNATRYRGFHYCNSLSFVASLLAMLLVQKEFLNEHHALEAAMLLDMLGLIGAYAIGSCRDQVSTLYAVGIAAAAVVYVFVHVSYFTLGEGDADVVVAQGVNKEEKDKLVEKMSRRFLLFAILVASITYQAGLTPPGGFLLNDDAQSGHHAGDPVLRYNYPRRYTAFFYCNSMSFMVSIVVILLLINPIEYKPAIRSHALSVCSAVSYVCLMGAFAAGSTQHMKGSIYVLAAVTFVFCLVISLWSWIYLRQLKDDNANSNDSSNPNPNSNSNRGVGGISDETNRGAKAPLREKGGGEPDIENMRPGDGKQVEATTTSSESEKKKSKSVYSLRSFLCVACCPHNKDASEATHTKGRGEYLVTLAILVASATYPAGLDPPGGSWQSSSDGHEAGNPMMLDNRRPRYFVFFISNTTSFMASIILIHMLLPAMLRKTEVLHELYKKGLRGLVYLQCLGFLVAYAAGSNRRWKTSLYTGSALVIVMLAFFSMHVCLSIWRQNKKKDSKNKKSSQNKDDGEQTVQQNKKNSGGKDDDEQIAQP